MPANMEGSSDPLVDDAAVYLVTASGDNTCKYIPAASAATIFLTTEATGTHIKSAASSATVTEVLPRPAGASKQIGLKAGPPTVHGATVMEVLPRPAGASTQINPEADPPTVNGAEAQGATPSDRSTRINAVCNSYAEAHKYLEEYVHQEKGNQEMEMTATALAD
jgi:hypothetical protein